MKAILALLLIITTHARALTADEIRKIAAKPHSRENLVEALKIFPDARQYKVTQKSGPTMNALKALPEIAVMEKTVEGKYIVTETAPDDPIRVIMVVHHEAERGVFRKWVLAPDGSVGSSTGVADADTRTIAWISDELHGMRVLVHESHGGKQVTWREVVMKEDKIVALTLGLAVKVK